MEVVDAVVDHGRGQGDSLRHLVGGQAGDVGREFGEAASQVLVAQGVAELGPELAGLGGARHPRDLGAHPRDLAGQDLGDDEGLGEARVDLEDVSDAGHATTS